MKKANKLQSPVSFLFSPVQKTFIESFMPFSFILCKINDVSILPHGTLYFQKNLRKFRFIILLFLPLCTGFLLKLHRQVHRLAAHGAKKQRKRAPWQPQSKLQSQRPSPVLPHSPRRIPSGACNACGKRSAHCFMMAITSPG